VSILAAAACLAGCATGRIDTLAAGAGPDLTGFQGFAFAHQDRPADQALEQLVQERLRSKGLVPAAGPAARYIVDVSYDERPLDVGAYTAATPPAKDDRSGWYVKPVGQSWWTSKQMRICTVAIRVWEPGTGAEVYRVQAARRGRSADCARAKPALVTAALREIPLPPPRG
jgi:hypothetical protein